MSVWSLASLVRTGSLALGKTTDEISKSFGDPTDIAQNIFKYDAVELHFVDDVLRMIHSEFGEAPLPSGVHSEALGIQPDGLQWPLQRDSLAQLVTDKGLDLQVRPHAWGVEYQFGLATVMIHESDGLASWSISPNQEADGSHE